ncbi:MAG: DUF4908 domain-containing protein [Robiginitomaculum sp.]|nr:DUF4908 domain-containing protein [Robiginitomaculum sp.]
MMSMKYRFFFLLLTAIWLFAGVSNAQAQQENVNNLAADDRVVMPPISEPIPDTQEIRKRFATESHVNRPNIREVFELRQRRFTVQRFEGLAGLPPFILDNSGSITLFRYERGGEVLVLQPVHTTRGDIVYKNDRGMVVLKLRRVGGATVFMRPKSRGIVAWSTGQGSNIGPPTVSLRQMTRVLRRIANDLAQKLGQDIEISVRGANEENAWIFLDTANNVRIGVYRYLRNNRKNQTLRDLSRIEIFAANELVSSMDDGVLKLEIIPGEGYFGRMSSFQIQYSLFGNQSVIDGLPAAIDQNDLVAEFGLPENMLLLEGTNTVSQTIEP